MRNLQSIYDKLLEVYKVVMYSMYYIRKVFPHPPYSPDLAPSDYHMFRSMQNALTGIRLTSEQGIKNWLDSFVAAKPAQFFWDGIHKLPERWKKVIVLYQKRNISLLKRFLVLCKDRKDPL